MNDALPGAPFASDAREELPDLLTTALNEIEAVRVWPYDQLHCELTQDTVAVEINQALEVSFHLGEFGARPVFYRQVRGDGNALCQYALCTHATNNPSHFTKAFSREVTAAKLPHVTFHGLRHTHITHLLKRGVPVHVVSARAGHANPTVTLNIYAHELPGQQEDAAAVMDAALRQALTD